MTVESFLTAEQEQEVVAAIRVAEKQTSGEIRVHIENYDNTNFYERTQEVFHLLKMDKTKAENGVILYVAVNAHQFVIYGDKGIHERVGDSFWNATRDVIQSKFKQQLFIEGLVDGILEIGKALEKYFPWETTDNNELSDKISKG